MAAKRAAGRESLAMVCEWADQEKVARRRDVNASFCQSVACLVSY